MKRGWWLAPRAIRVLLVARLRCLGLPVPSNAECSRGHKKQEQCTGGPAVATNNQQPGPPLAVLERPPASLGYSWQSERTSSEQRAYALCASVTCIWPGPAHGCGCLLAASGETRRARAVVLGGPFLLYLCGVRGTTPAEFHNTWHLPPLHC
jgi:hypothetical protein